VISATTEARREGYFRREWRLAVERTLDLADDVMFLVPVVIDDTRDAGARVPEKFFTVQWLRAPGGQSTPALEELAERLARGDSQVTASIEADDPPAEPKAKKKRAAAEPPPFPKFPAFPEHGNKGRFLYDLVVWFGHLMLAFWGHLPKFVRIIAATVVVFNVISIAFKTFQANPSAPARRQRTEVADEVKQMLDAAGIKPSAKDREKKAGDAIASLVNAAAEGLQGGRAIAAVTFSGEGPGAGEYAGKVFEHTFQKLSVGRRVALSPFPFDTEPADTDILERGLRLKSRFVLTGYAKAAADQATVFTAKIYDVKTRAVIWSGTYDPAKTDAKETANMIVAELQRQTRPLLAPPNAPAPPEKDADAKDDEDTKAEDKPKGPGEMAG
jgi:hypothetical protein